MPACRYTKSVGAYTKNQQRTNDSERENDKLLYNIMCVYRLRKRSVIAFPRVLLQIHELCVCEFECVLELGSFFSYHSDTDKRTRTNTNTYYVFFFMKFQLGQNCTYFSFCRLNDVTRCLHEVNNKILAQKSTAAQISRNGNVFMV